MNDFPKPSFVSSPTALHLMALAILGYGWQVHGFWLAIGLWLAFYVAVFVLNHIAILVFESLRLTTLFRVAAFAIFMILIAVFGADVCDANGKCRSLL